MDHVPLLFAESVARLLDYDSRSSLIQSRSSLFGNVSRSLMEKSFCVTLNVGYNPAAGTFDYYLTCRRPNGSICSYDPADHRFVPVFRVISFALKNMEKTWTTATPSDLTFLKLLRTPSPLTELVDVNCPELLKMLPDYCTFNYISAYDHGAFDHSEVLEAIVERSQACGRLEEVNCKEFFTKRGFKASIDWISTNKRLRRISGYSIESPESVRSALNRLGVQ